MSESKLSRTTVSMDGDLYDRAVERLKKLGYSSFSEYIQFLLEADLRDRTPHVTVRDESSGPRHLRRSTYLDSQVESLKVAEPGESIGPYGAGSAKPGEGSRPDNGEGAA